MASVEVGSGASYEKAFPFETQIGPLINRSADRRVTALVEDAVGGGATAIASGAPDVRVANDTEYGLAAAVLSSVSDTTVHDEPQMPFGGVKASGWGRFGGRAALEEFTDHRWITVQELPREYPI